VSAGKFGLRRDKVIGIAAAAASFVPLTMFRPEDLHFLGPATPLAPLIVLTIAYLPGLLFQQMHWREPFRLVLVAAFIEFYSLPQLIYPNIDAAARGLNVLKEVWWHAAEPSGNRTTLIARRLGFAPEPNAQCCGLTYAEIEQLIRGISDLTDGRSVFVDSAPNLPPPAVYYFLGNLRAPISYTDPMSTLWVDSDMAQWQRELRDAKPQCVVTSDPIRPLPKLMLDMYGEHTEHKLVTKSNTLTFTTFIFCAR
jgi:hypothetical protein